MPLSRSLAENGESENAASSIDCFPLCNARVNGIAYFSVATARIVKVHLHRAPAKRNGRVRVRESRRRRVILLLSRNNNRLSPGFTKLAGHKKEREEESGRRLKAQSATRNCIYFLIQLGLIIVINLLRYCFRRLRNSRIYIDTRKNGDALYVNGIWAKMLDARRSAVLPPPPPSADANSRFQNADRTERE